MMMKRLFFILPLLLVLFAACNKEASYSVKLKNLSAGPVRITVRLDQAFAAPGQNTLKLDKTVLQGQSVEIYYNKGVGISLPTVNDSLLKYTVQVLNQDSVPSNRNFRNLNNYSTNGSNTKKKIYIYEGPIVVGDFL